MKSLLAGLLFVLISGVAIVSANNDDKIYICHAAGQEGTTQFVTLHIPENAVYGKNGESGHFNENGTPKAGHEQDYLGACRESLSSPSVSPSPESSTKPCEREDEDEQECESPEPSASPSPSISPSVSPSPSSSPNSSSTASPSASPNEEKHETIINFSDEHPEDGQPSKSGK